MLTKLMIGVHRFQEEKYHPMQQIFELLSKGQHPQILFITCSDSRLIPSLLTQTNPGDLFVIRNAGNIIPPAQIPSGEGAGIEFALNEFKTIKDIIICGHSYCGAMKGLLTPNLKDQLPTVASWLTHSKSVLDQLANANDSHSSMESKIHKATQLNILAQIEHLKSYPIVAEKIARNELTIHGWLYEFEKGEVLVYEPQSRQFIPFANAWEHLVTTHRDKIIKQTAMKFLESLSHPQTEKEYKELMHLFDQLENNVLVIWLAIKNEVIKNIGIELGESYSDKDKIPLNTLIADGWQLKLKDLKDLQKNIMESPGYQQYIRKIMRYSLFTAELNSIARVSTYQSIKAPML